MSRCLVGMRVGLSEMKRKSWMKILLEKGEMMRNLSKTKAISDLPESFSFDDNDFIFSPALEVDDRCYGDE